MSKNNGHQFVKNADASFAFGDIVDNVFLGLIDLPVGAQAIGGRLIIDTVFDSTTNPIDVGDGVSVNRYKGAVDGKAAALTALVPTGYKTLSTSRTIGITMNFTGANPTAGAGRLEVEYVVDGAADFNQR